MPNSAALLEMSWSVATLSVSQFGVATSGFLCAVRIKVRVRVRVDSRNTFPDGLVCVRPPVSAEWLWYCVRLWSTSVDQSDSARGVSTPAIAGQASSAQAILRGQVLGTISEGCNTPRVPAHCCIPLRSLYSDISQCDFRRHPQSKAVLMRFALVFSELELLEHRALIMAIPDVRRG